VRQDRVRFQAALAAQNRPAGNLAPNGQSWSEYAEFNDLTAMRAKIGMGKQEPYVHDYVFERPGRRVPYENDCVDAASIGFRR
jgi:hypothetical protein